MSEWKEVRLGDIISIKSGLAYKGTYIGRGNNLLLGMGCVSFNENFLDSGARLYEDDCDSRYYVYPGDIVLATRQQSDNLPILAMPAIIPSKYEGKKLIFGTNLYKIENNSEVDNRFLFWLLKTSNYINYIASVKTGTTVRMVTKKNVEDYSFLCPPKQIRDEISDLLWKLDSKIECNRKICANLEAQAQALFKHWFIDFTPFKDGKFVESELGMIPEGWRVGRLEELGEVISGATPSKAVEAYYTSKGIAWLTPKDLSNNSLKFTSRGEIDITQEGYDSCSAKIMPKGSVLFSSRAPIGYLTIAKNDICTNQGFKSVIPKYAGTAYIYYLLKFNTKRIENMSSGTTFKEASGSLIKSLDVIIPPKNILKDYENLVDDIFNEQEIIEQESLRLATLRSTLLPKLMSGEIKV